MAKRIIEIDDERINVAEAARILRTSPEGLRQALQDKRFNYFGEAWKRYEDGEKWTYYINPNRLLEYVGIAAARGVDLPEVREYLEEKAKEASQPENFSLLEKANLEKEIKKLKAENKKLKAVLSQILTEASQITIDK